MTDASDESRRASRSSVMLGVLIQHEDRSIPVRVGNISANGALIVGSFLPPAGSTVVLRRNELAIASRIAWVDSGNAGLEFDEPLQVEDLLRHLPQSRTIAQPRYRRPGFKHE